MQFMIIILLVLLNGLLAMSEIAVVSAQRARLKTRVEQGNRGAEAALALSEDPNRFLSTVQIGITLVGIIAGAFGGATVGAQFGNWLAQRIPSIAAYSETIGITLVVVLTTYLSLVIGELAPKRLGILYPEAIASAVAGPMQRLSRVVMPVVWLLSISTDAIIRLIGIDEHAGESLTDAEIVSMVQEGREDGAFDSEEVQMVHGVLQLDDIRVETIMTPRTNIAPLRLTDSIETINEQVINTPHAYYPVLGNDIDDVVGIIKAKDMLAPLMRAQEIDLTALMRPPLLIPGVTTASKALAQFKAAGVEMGIVVDEHGGVDGLLTVNDIIEEIVGDVDAEESNIVERDDGSLLVDGRATLASLRERLPTLPAEDVDGYRTVAGFVMAHLGRMPHIADSFEHDGLRVEVVDMDGARIDRVLIAVIEDDSQEGGGS